MKLPKSYFENLSATKYREYLKVLPSMQQENTHLFVMLALTFVALCVFGIFAINPTLSTIADLEKQVADNKQVDQQLTTKLNNLSILQQHYSQMGNDLTNIYNAIPQNANVPLLSAQVEALAKKHTLTITTYRVAEVQIASAKKVTKTRSFIFTLQAQGNYNDMLKFSSELANISRVITIENMEIGRDSKTYDLVLTLRGRQYFKTE
ncbi:MAG: type 4a pilus biogenesis protein PilO [Candidatus Levyibacteriota bacterium]